MHNVLYANGAAVNDSGRGDLGNAAQMLDAADAGNLTTTGTESQGIDGCVFSSGNPAAAFLALFESSGYGPAFGLAAGSPARRAGLGAFERPQPVVLGVPVRTLDAVRRCVRDMDDAPRLLLPRCVERFLNPTEDVFGCVVRNSVGLVTSANGSHSRH